LPKGKLGKPNAEWRKIDQKAAHWSSGNTP